MNEFVINVAQDPSTIININNSDGAVSLDVSQNQQNSITIEDDVNNVLLNPSVFYNGINIVYLSGVSGELLHNTFGGLQGGAANQYYHLSSGQYFNLTTGSVVRPNETGVFYPTSNPSGFITGVDLSLYVTGSVVRPSDTGNFITIFQTGAFYPRSNPSGYITGVDLSSYVTGQVVRPSETGVFYPTSNPSGYITGVDLSNYSTISFSTGISGYLQNQVTNLNNQTGSYYPRNNPSGYITGVDLSSYATIGFVTGISGYLQPQITNLNNQTGSYVTGSVVRPSETGVFVTQSQTGQFYAASNPSGFITGVDLSAYITGINNIVYTTGDQNISGVKTFGNNVGIGTASPSAKLHTISTTEQLRLGYDASNYMSATVSSAGAVTLNAVGASAEFAFSDPVTATAQTELTSQLATNSTSAMTRSLTEEFLLWTPNIMQYFPIAGSTTNGGSVSVSAGQSVEIALGTQSSGTARTTLVSDWQFSSAAGGTMRYDRPFKVRIPMNCNMNYSDATGQASCRVYVGSNGSFALPFAGQQPYPTGTRGVGVEWRKASGSFQQEFRLFARDGSSSTTGQFIATNYTGIGTNSNSNSKFYDLLLTFNTDTPTNPILNLYASPWIGSTDTVPSRQSPTPVLTLSGAGVPTGSAIVATNWGRIEAAVVGDGGAITLQGTTTRNYFRTIYLQQA